MGDHPLRELLPALGCVPRLIHRAYSEAHSKCVRHALDFMLLPRGPFMNLLHWEAIGQARLLTQRLGLGVGVRWEGRGQGLHRLYVENLAAIRFNATQRTLVPCQNKTLQTKEFYDCALAPFLFDDFGTRNSTRGPFNLVAAAAFGEDYLTAPPQINLVLTDGELVIDKVDLSELFDGSVRVFGEAVAQLPSGDARGLVGEPVDESSRAVEGIEGSAKAQ